MSYQNKIDYIMDCENELMERFDEEHPTGLDRISNKKWFKRITKDIAKDYPSFDQDTYDNMPDKLKDSYMETIEENKKKRKEYRRMYRDYVKDGQGDEWFL